MPICAPGSRTRICAELPPVEGMKRLVSNTFDHFVATPDLIRLMSIENIHYAEHLKNSSVDETALWRSARYHPHSPASEARSEGVFRGQVDAIDLYLSISGLAYFFLSNQHTLSWLLDRDLVARRRLQKRRQHVVEMVLSYLTQISQAQAGEGETE